MLVKEAVLEFFCGSTSTELAVKCLATELWRNERKWNLFVLSISFKSIRKIRIQDILFHPLFQQQVIAADKCFQTCSLITADLHNGERKGTQRKTEKKSDCNLSYAINVTVCIVKNNEYKIEQNVNTGYSLTLPAYTPLFT